MKTPKSLYSRLSLITSVMLITGYLIVSAVWTDMSRVGAGNQLTADLWNTFVDNLNDLDTRLKSTASTWPTVTSGIAYTGGYVGIGTTSPIVKFQVRTATDHNLWVYDTAGAVRIGAGNDAGTVGVPIYLTSDIWVSGSFGIGTTNPGAYRTAIRGSTDDNTASALWVSGASSLTGALVVRNDGNVGIGTATPGETLSVVAKSGINVSSFTLQSGVKWRMVDNAGDLSWYDSNGGVYYALRMEDGHTAHGPIIKADGGFIVQNGNVGIGTMSPYAKLHSMGQTFMMGSTTDLVWGSVGTVFQGEFGATSGNTYTKLESFIGGGSAYGDLVLNLGGGNVGIGTTPGVGYKLSVAGNVVISNNGAYGFGDSTVFVNGVSGASGYMLFRVNSTERMRINAAGNVLINTATDAGYKLDVNGTVRGTSWTNSDRNLKKNIQTLSGALDKVEALRGVTYEWKDQTKGKGEQVGIIAQEVEKVFPELVNIDKQGVRAVNYSALVSPLIEAVKELKRENDELKKRIERLEKR